MEKVIRAGRTADGSLFAKIEFNNGKLSISGVVGPKSNGDARGSCGQVIMSFKEYDKRGYLSIETAFREFAPGWSLETARKFFDLWDRWHLNDMRAGCEHQRDWDTGKELDLIDWTWGDDYHAMWKRAQDGKMSAGEFAFWPFIVSRVEAATIKSPRCKTETEETLELERECWIRRGKIETKAAGWVYPVEHPEGLLTKPCDVCGYKYGTAWKREEVPQEVIDWLFALPDTDVLPAWV
jgi:hypothetical protein